MPAPSPDPAATLRSPAPGLSSVTSSILVRPGTNRTSRLLPGHGAESSSVHDAPALSSSCTGATLVAWIGAAGRFVGQRLGADQRLRLGPSLALVGTKLRSPWPVRGSCPGTPWWIGCSPRRRRQLSVWWRRRTTARRPCSPSGPPEGGSGGWVSVDQRDKDPVVLSSYLVAALDRLEPLDQQVVDAATHVAAHCGRAGRGWDTSSDAAFIQSGGRCKVGPGRPRWVA
jgi:hypothetical protein